MRAFWGHLHIGIDGISDHDHCVVKYFIGAQFREKISIFDYTHTVHNAATDAKRRSLRP